MEITLTDPSGNPFTYDTITLRMVNTVSGVTQFNCNGAPPFQVQESMSDVLALDNDDQLREYNTTAGVVICAKDSFKSIARSSSGGTLISFLTGSLTLAVTEPWPSLIE